METSSIYGFLQRLTGRRKSRQRRKGRTGSKTAGSPETLESRQLLTVNFSFNYQAAIGAGSAIGFEDPTSGAARRAALEDAASRYGAMFANDATVVLDVTSSDNPGSGTLASAGSQYVASGSPGAFGGIEVVRNKIVNGNDLNGASADGSVDVNWGQNWEISSNPSDIDNTEFDFYSTIYHELTHALGFASVIDQNGDSLFGVQPGQPGNWSLFDRYIVDSAGTAVIDTSGTLNATVWNAGSVGGNSAGNLGLFFNGPTAMAANNGQPIGLYTPTTWNPGSSVSHIDTDNPAYAGMIMLHAGGPGAESRTFTSIEQGILIDLGYTFADTIVVTETNGTTTVSDLGQTDRISVVLGRRPTSDVVLNITSADTGEVTLSASTLTFTPTNWNVAQTITLTGVGDGIPDGDQVTLVRIAVDDAASDDTFDAVPDETVQVTSIDDDGLIPAKPVLTGPPAQAPNNMPVFEWTSGANSATFVLTVTNLQTGTVAQRAIDLTANQHVFAGLFADGIYQAEVQAFNVLGQAGPVSDPLIFSVGVPLLPAAPTIIAPSANATVTVSRPVIEWQSVPAAFSYELYFDSNGRVSTVTTQGTTTPTGTLSYTPIQDLMEGANSVWVRGLNAFGEPGEWSEVVRFTVDAVAAPGRPIMTSPSVTTTSNAFPRFAWTTGGAETFELWVAGQRAGTGVSGIDPIFDRVIHLTDFAGTQYTHFNALKEGFYRAWVRGKNSAGEFSEWSEVNEFTIAIDNPVTPVLHPIGTTTDVTPVFRWDGDGHTYDLWVNNISTGQSQVIRQTSLSGNSFEPTTPLAQGRYRAWIQAYNATGEKSAWSAAMIFTVDVPAPSRPTVTGPVGTGGTTGRDVETAKPTFTWAEIPDAASYELWVNHVESRTARIVYQTGLTTTSFTSEDFLLQGTYRVWVRARNSAGEVSEWSQPYEFFLDVPTPATPTITGPKPNSVGSVEDSTPTITWTTLQPAATYDLQLEVVSSGTRLIDTTGITTQSYTVTQVLSEQSYRVRVRGKNLISTDASANEAGDWSDWYVFRIDEPNATTPIALLPVGTVTSSTVTFQWQHTPGNIRYEILVRDLLNQETVTIQVSDILLDISGTRASTTFTLPSGTYRYWVRAFNSLGTASSWSNSQAFNVVAAVSPESKQFAEYGDSPVVELVSLEFALTTPISPDTAANSAEPSAVPQLPPQSADVQTADSNGDPMPAAQPGHLPPVAPADDTAML
ncbi:MAG: fibronectin type III domain-containing protein, partial [Planctomycetaceae bacterium]|nr:fibronectin type III domain-containing protein [Planctomycetaceae bacterium]